MINKVAFCGREAMLTKPAKKVTSKLHEYVSPSTLLNQKEIIESSKKVSNKTNVANIYTSPFAPTGTLPKNELTNASNLPKIDYFG